MQSNIPSQFSTPPTNRNDFDQKAQEIREAQNCVNRIKSQIASGGNTTEVLTWLMQYLAEYAKFDRLQQELASMHARACKSNMHTLREMIGKLYDQKPN